MRITVKDRSVVTYGDIKPSEVFLCWDKLFVKQAGGGDPVPVGSKEPFSIFTQTTPVKRVVAIIAEVE